MPDSVTIFPEVDSIAGTGIQYYSTYVDDRMIKMAKYPDILFGQTKDNIRQSMASKLAHVLFDGRGYSVSATWIEHRIDRPDFRGIKILLTVTVLVLNPALAKVGEYVPLGSILVSEDRTEARVGDDTSHGKLPAGFVFKRKGAAWKRIE